MLGFGQWTVAVQILCLANHTIILSRLCWT